MEAFKGGFYKRKNEARIRIRNWMVAQNYNDKKLEETPPQFQQYRKQTWKDFVTNLKDQVAPPNSTITEKLEEMGLKDVDGELVKI